MSGKAKRGGEHGKATAPQVCQQSMPPVVPPDNPSQGTLTLGVAGLGGASFSSSTASPHTTIKGDDGSFPGGGGAGGNNAYASGKGAPGYVVIEEYS